jgi:16S rRNA (adenine1518-N6/adenine1519-N6)-dimethyltransferase
MLRNERQTISYLKKRFDQVGMAPDSRHGQNFLVDLNLVRMIADSAQIQSNDVVLEIGTGMGSLTAMLAEKAAKVITVEIDEHLHQLAREELEAFDNIELLQLDALRNKNHFDDLVIDAVRNAVNSIPDARFKLAANLPYNIATPVISNLLLWEIQPASMTVTIQKELGDRIIAPPRTKDYGSLSIWIQCQCRASIVRVMPPSVFWPRPKVDSSIVHMVLDPDLRNRIPDLPFFHQFVRTMFFHRRKFLRSVAISGFKDQLSKSEVDEVLQEMQLGADARTEQLTVEELLRLGELFRNKLNK